MPKSYDDRARKKLRQLTEEFSKPKTDWHSIQHLARDLAAAANAANERQKHKK